jgi:hypothetical protein
MERAYYYEIYMYTIYCILSIFLLSFLTFIVQIRVTSFNKLKHFDSFDVEILCFHFFIWQASDKFIDLFKPNTFSLFRRQFYEYSIL